MRVRLEGNGLATDTEASGISPRSISFRASRLDWTLWSSGLHRGLLCCSHLDFVLRLLPGKADSVSERYVPHQGCHSACTLLLTGRYCVYSNALARGYPGTSPM